MFTSGPDGRKGLRIPLDLSLASRKKWNLAFALPMATAVYPTISNSLSNNRSVMFGGGMVSVKSWDAVLCECFACMYYMCTTFVPGAQGDQKRASDPLDGWKLPRGCQAPNPNSLQRAASAFHCRLNSPVPLDTQIKSSLQFQLSMQGKCH